jgi:hypothetical protein
MVPYRNVCVEGVTRDALFGKAKIKTLLRNPKRGGQGPNWAVEPYDDNDDENKKKYAFNLL